MAENFGGRLYSSTPELDKAELAWWQTFANIEEQYCWVQPRAIHRFLRKEYVHAIVSKISDGDRVAEVGCGVGWLTTMLVEGGASEAVGIDFSPEQIRRAKARAESAGLANCVRFELGDVSEVAERQGKFDVILAHAFLHHLSTLEIKDVLRKIHSALVPRGRLLIVEPVKYGDEYRDPQTDFYCRRLQWLTNIPNRGRRSGLRRTKTAEAAARSLIARRSVGCGSLGPSPKEIPFKPGEINELANFAFEITRSTRCTAGSLKVAEELLLMRLSHPVVSRLIQWPILWLAKFYEKRLLASRNPPASTWVFELFECVAK